MADREALRWRRGLNWTHRRTLESQFLRPTIDTPLRRALAEGAAQRKSNRSQLKSQSTGVPNVLRGAEATRPLVGEDYQVGEDEQLDALETAIRYYQAYGDEEAIELLAEESHDSMAEGPLQSLSSFLTRYGPLRRISSMTTVTDDPESECPSEIDVWEMHYELVDLGKAVRRVRRPMDSAARALLVERLGRAAKAAFEEATITPQADRHGRLVLFPVPRSLRCALWIRVVLESEGRLTEQCPYCGKVWPLSGSPHRGHPVWYCEEHRGEKWRKRVARGRAPFRPGDVA